MQKLELIKKLFYERAKNEISQIWNDVYDVGLSSIMGKVSLNILQLDYWLKKVYHSEYTDDMSMKEFVDKKFGEEISNKILE